MTFHQSRVAEDVGGRTGGTKLAAVEQQHSVTEIDDDVEIVRRDDLAAGELFEDSDQRAACSRIETAKRFVEPRARSADMRRLRRDRHVFVHRD